MAVSELLGYFQYWSTEFSPRVTIALHQKGKKWMALRAFATRVCQGICEE